MPYVEANVILLDLELRGLLQRGEFLDGEERYILTPKGHKLAGQVLASLPVEHAVLIGVLLGRLETETST